jgi:hypothetical protein
VKSGLGIGFSAPKTGSPAASRKRTENDAIVVFIMWLFFWMMGAVARSLNKSVAVGQSLVLHRILVNKKISILFSESRRGEKNTSRCGDVGL